MTPKIKKAAIEIAEEVCNKEIITGRNPATVATSVLHFALKLHGDGTISVKDISDHSKTRENTIKSAYEILIKNKDQIIPIHFQSIITNLDY